MFFIDVTREKVVASYFLLEAISCQRQLLKLHARSPKPNVNRLTK